MDMATFYKSDKTALHTFKQLPAIQPMRRFTYAKVKNKLSRIIDKTVYHNYAYKPSGIYYSSKEYIDSIKGNKPAYVEVYPDLVTHLNVPAELYALHLKPAPQLTLQTNYMVVEIPNGRVYSDSDCSVAIISADNKLIHDLSFTYTETDTVEPENNNIFRRRYFAKPSVYKGVVFSMQSGGATIVNIGHWITDILPRLHLLKASGLFDKVDYFLVPSLKKDFQKESLQLMGIPLEKVIDGEDHPHVTADAIIASTAHRNIMDTTPQWTIDFLRDSLVKNDFDKSKYPPHIYISRKDTSIRNVVNEDQVMELLSQYGFVSYQLSQLSVLEKIRLFASADMVVGPTGAGLIYLYFCKAKAKVLEIFSNLYVVGPSFDIAGKAGLDYHYIISKAIGNGKGLEEHIHVDIDQLKRALDKMIEGVKEPASI